MIRWLLRMLRPAPYVGRHRAGVSPWGTPSVLDIWADAT